MDRIGLRAWRERRRKQQRHNGAYHSSVPHCLVHVIERSSPFSGFDDTHATGEHGIHVVRSPKSGVSFFDLGDFDRQFDAARRRARTALELVCGSHAQDTGPVMFRDTPLFVSNGMDITNGFDTGISYGQGRPLEGAVTVASLQRVPEEVSK